jgi:hypothetical protein
MSGIPDVPPTTADMRQFLLSLKGAVETLTQTIDNVVSSVQGDGTDITPPAAPVGLSASSASGGVTLSWTNPGDEDLLLVEVWENTTNTQPNVNTQPTKRVGTVYALPGQVGTFNRAGVTTGQHLFYWVRAVDTSGNASDFNATSGVDVYVTAATGDGVAPNVPTSVTATQGFQDIWLTWTNPADSDLDHVLVFENTTNNSSTANIVASVPASPSTAGSYDRSGLPNNTTRYYWLKAVDKDGNASGFSAVASATTATIDPTDLGTVIGFNAPTGLSVTTALSTNTDGLQIVNLNISWNAIADSRLSFYEVAVSEAGGSFVVYTTGDLFLLLRVRGNTAYAVKVRGVDRNGNRTNYSATVNQTSATQTIGPAAAINAGATKIDPGMVLISGASTLASWRDGGDNTKIAGGSIAANTISANLLQIGARGLDINGLSFEGNTTSVGSGVFSFNTIAWSAGTISYVQDNGTPTTVGVIAGNAAWGSGALYIYWTKGAATLSATTSTAVAYTANTVVMAVYAGATNVNVTYGRTIIDGTSIKTGSVDADRLGAGTITTNLMSANSINGDRIAANTLDATKIIAGSVTATQIQARSLSADRIAAGVITATEIQAAGISNFYFNSYSGTGPFIDNVSDTFLLSKAYTPGDSDVVLVLFNVFFENASASTTFFGNVKVWRDTTQLTWVGTRCAASSGTWFVSFVVDQPPANPSVTYKLTGDTDDTNSSQMRATTAILNVIRWRR